LLFGGCTRRLVGAWLALCPLACQAILGDFKTEEQNAAPQGLGTTCEPSAFRCDGADLQACSPDRRGWQLVAHCASAGQCDASAAACRSCTPGEAGCNDRERQLCNSAGELAFAEDCGAAARCVLKGDRSVARCSSALCEPGAFMCDGNRLRTCAPEGDHWTLVARCASVPLCDKDSAAEQAARGVAPTCLPPLCLPGTFACDGATPERCNADQNAWEPLAPCADPASCNASDGSCTPALDGTVACSGADLVAKKATGFATIEHCGSASLCDAAAGACKRSECGAAGTLRCNEELPNLEECAADGTWVTREVCDARALCSVAERRCFPPACAPEGTRCVGQAFQVCSADLTHWETKTTCGDDQTCGAAGCESGGCTSGARCVETSAEVCSDGRWVPRLRCATAGLCLPASGTCGDPMCGGALGEYQCTSDERLRSCPPDRTQWSTAPACAEPTPFCDADPSAGGGRPVCNACKPLSYACDGPSLTRCAADGQSSPTIASCPGGCSVVSGIPSCL
jgi:hypothetical protein